MLLIKCRGQTPELHNPQTLMVRQIVPHFLHFLLFLFRKTLKLSAFITVMSLNMRKFLLREDQLDNIVMEESVFPGSAVVWLPSRAILQGPVTIARRKRGVI